MRATKASLAVLGLSAVLAGGVISGAGAANAAGCEGGYPPAQCKVAISDNTVRPGEPVSFQADGFRGGESVSGDVHSVVVHVGTYSANSKGVVTGTFTVPSGLSNGTHTFTLTGLGSGVIKSAKFQVTGAPAGGGNGNGAGTARALDLHGDHRLAVEQSELRSVRNGVADRRDLIEPHVAAVGERDVERVQVAGAFDDCERAHRLARIADFAAPAGQLLLDAT